MKNKKILVVLGGTSNERKVSLNSGKECVKALKKKGYKVKIFDPKKKPLNLIDKKKTDIIFNALHGKDGEDGIAQSYFEYLKIPYTHSGVQASSIAMDKNLAKICFKEAGIPVVEHIILDESFSLKNIPFKLPYVIKPLAGGSSVDVKILKNENDWQPFKNSRNKNKKYLVEPYIPGRELTVATLGNKPLIVTDIISDNWYNYDAKYKIGASKHIIPAKIPVNIEKLCLDYALIAHDKLGCRGVTRTDFRWNEKLGSKGLFILELNTQPGMTPTSLVPEQANFVGMSFEDLCDWLIEDACIDKT